MPPPAPPPVLNTATLWGRVFARTLAQLATENAAAPLHAFISPGSRSTPLAAALAAEPAIHAVPVLDERTAAFLALGAATARRAPAIVVCTSGTAAANYLPAIVEAWHSQVPLLVATADRPAELRGRGAGQTIEQNGIYGVHTVFAREAPAPAATPDALAAWETLLRAAWHAALGNNGAASGPAHLNIPLNEPLAPASVELDFALTPALAAFLESGTRGAPVSPQFAETQSDREHPRSTAPTPQPATDEAAVETCATSSPPAAAPPALDEILAWAAAHPNGVIVAGAPAAPRDHERTARAALALASRLGWPLLADALHPTRHRAAAAVIANYDAFLRDTAIAAALRPDAVIQLDQLPTSKTLRQWLAAAAAPTLQISPAGRDLNPLHRNHRILPAAIADYAEAVGCSALADCAASAPPPLSQYPLPDQDSARWLALWLQHERAAAALRASAPHSSVFPSLSSAHGTKVPAESGTEVPHSKTRWASEDCGVGAGCGDTGETPVPLLSPLHAAAASAAARPLFEGEIIRALAAALPDDAVIFLANSMTVRDAESFWPAANTRRRVHCNRGANGIDGTLGTALGLAFAAAAPPVFLLTGDLAFLHDSNALAVARHLPPHASLTVILINNDGGGIFNTLPVARENPDFERFWGTPQHVDIALLCAAHGVPHRCVETLAALAAAVAVVPPPPGLRVLELRTDRAHSAALRMRLLAPPSPHR